MVVVSSRFERIAESVAERTAELLGAAVSVLDERGVAVASSDPDVVGLRFGSVHGGATSGRLRIPIRLGAHTGEVVVADPVGGELVSPRLARALVELVINQATVVDRLPNQQALKDKFIHDLLYGAPQNDADVCREGQILGMDVTPPRAVILIDAADFIQAGRTAAHPEPAEAHSRRRAQLVIASVVGFFDLPTDTICGYIGGGEVAVLKASTTQDLVAWTDDRTDGPDQPSASWANLTALKRAASALLTRLRHDTNAPINIGIGRYHPGIRGLSRSFQDARAALTLGRRFQGRNHVHCLDALGVAAFVGVGDERTKIDLARHLLSPLDDSPELLETLDTFFAENCCSSSTASRLSIHRNTLGYRFDKIQSLTGLDPRRFDDAIQIRLSLVLRTLRAEAA